MTKAISLRQLGPAVPLFVAIIAFCLLRFGPMDGNSALIAMGVTVDLTILSPLLYWLIIRKTSIPNITIVPVFIFGTLIAGILIPSEDQQTLAWIKQWVVPIVELAALGVIGYHFMVLRKNLKKERTQNTDFFSALKLATAQVFPPKVSDFLAMELATFYYGFLHWKKPPRYGYTYHKTGGTIAILILFTCLVPVEAVVLHLLIQQWSDTAAWILTIISLYTALQLFGIIRSIKPRPIEILQDQLWLKYGILAEVKIPMHQITSIQRIKGGAAPEGAMTLSPIAAFEGCNVQLTCHEVQTIRGLYGITKKAKTIAFTVDQVNPFIEEVTRKAPGVAESEE
ncbi:MAG: hypothetical protein AAGA85_05325 [Bacteroidota bacterium]